MRSSQNFSNSLKRGLWQNFIIIKAETFTKVIMRYLLQHKMYIILITKSILMNSKKYLPLILARHKIHIWHHNSLRYKELALLKLIESFIIIWSKKRAKLIQKVIIKSTFQIVQIFNPTSKFHFTKVLDLMKKQHISLFELMQMCSVGEILEFEGN
ncbi:Hypothetical_protein [Hexamita inflata]|uniref:Hypothetical_protein n=1 Tax=Hexamita inflata TaxID=28002 RepID=A0ABP1I3U0_9EUKA